VVALTGHRWRHLPLAGNGRSGQYFEIDSPGYDGNPAPAMLDFARSGDDGPARVIVDCSFLGGQHA